MERDIKTQFSQKVVIVEVKVSNRSCSALSINEHYFKQVMILFCILLGGSWRFIRIEKTKVKNTALSDMHSIEKLMLIHNLWFLNYGLVHVTRILTFYQNKLLSKKSIFSRSTLYFQINKNLSYREFYADYFKPSKFKKRFKK